jgi:hypothetical protein
MEMRANTALGEDDDSQMVDAPDQSGRKQHLRQMTDVPVEERAAASRESPTPTPRSRRHSKPLLALYVTFGVAVALVSMLVIAALVR